MKKLILIYLILLLSGCNTLENNPRVAANLSEAYKNYFEIGVAVTSNNISSLIEEDLIDEFDTFTAEYEMKWDQVEISNNNYYFNNCDKLVDFAIENNKTI